MLKFRYLFNNPDLALMLLKNWKYDEDSINSFQFFRISANAIYPIKINGEMCFLRLSPVSEKREENVLAELAFLGYLREEGFPAVQALPDKTGVALVRKETPWGEYYASVFKRVAGKQLSQTDFNDEIMFLYGATLGELHELSKSYEKGTPKRWTHADVFDWIEMTLCELGKEQKPLHELMDLRDEFALLALNRENYGLIHFDFEPDNVFFEEKTRQCSVIDFDDAMYHWYVMDIVQALYSIQDEMEIEDCSHQEAVFLSGYHSKCAIDDQLISKKTLFRRFANLFQYTRVARAMQEHWENEPDWMIELREKFLTRFLLIFLINSGMIIGHNLI
jgi:Ser/Thr protein kinase RdoA (MazF antagonist)